jgi:hypothetical protein
MSKIKFNIINGFFSIETNSAWVRLRLGLLLIFRYGFYRWGSCTIGIDETIYPSFLRFGICICAGWDNFSGYYLMANDQKSDEFLRRFYDKHGH